MYFSQEFWIGLSFACIGAGGISLCLSRRKHSAPTVTDIRGQTNFKKENLKDDIEQFFDAESRSLLSISDAESRSFLSVSDGESSSYRTISDEESGSFWSISDVESASFYTIPDENLDDNTTRVKSLGELYMDAEVKRAFRDLQHNFKVVETNCLALKNHVADAVNIFKQTIDDQQLLIDGLKLEVSLLKKDLYCLTADQLKNADATSAQTNTEKPNSCKLRRLKMRVASLESDVMKNSTDIVGINRTLMLKTALNSQCHRPTAPTSASLTPAAGPPPLSPVRRQPPPPSAVTSENVGTPPPPPKTTVTATFRRDPAVYKPCTTYCRASITEESLRSVVLKPVARRT